MNDQIQENTLRPRINPFSFPSATTSRFVLLIMILIGFNLSLYSTIHSTAMIKVQGTNPHKTVWECEQRLGTVPSALQRANYESYSKAQAECQIPVRKLEKEAALYAFGNVGAILLAALLIHVLFPFVSIRLRGLTPVTEQPNMAEVSDYIKGICAEIGMVKIPQLLLQPGSRAIGGRAFGCFGHYYLALPAGLVILFDTDRPAFRAILLHELAHLRNGDVDQTYISLFASCTYAGAMLITAFLFWSGDNFATGWRSLGLSLLVYLTLTGIIRSREFYADLRSSMYLGKDSLIRILAETPSLTIATQPAANFTDKYRAYIRNWDWRSAIRFHPTAEERQSVIDHPDRLFHSNFWEAVAIGMAISAAFGSFMTISDELLPEIPWAPGSTVPLMPEMATSRPGLSAFVAALLFTPIIASTIGLGVWRGRFVSLAYNMPINTGFLGIGIGIGLLAGQVLSISGFGIVLSPAQSMAGAFWYCLWIMVFLACVYYFFKWVGYCASAWLPIAVTSPSSRPYYVIGLGITGLLIAGFLSMLYFGLIFLRVGMPTSGFDLIRNLMMSFWGSYILWADNFSFTVALLLLWILPLSSCLRTKAMTDSNSPASWVFLDRVTAWPVARHANGQAIGSSIRYGLKAAAIFIIALIALRITARIAVPKSVRNTDSFKPIIGFWIYIAPAVLIQSVSAAILFRRAQYLGFAHGLLAAFVGGVSMTASALIVTLAFGGGISLGFLGMMFTLIVNLGGIFSLMAMLAVSWFDTLTCHLSLRSRPYG